MKPLYSSLLLYCLALLFTMSCGTKAATGVENASSTTTVTETNKDIVVDQIMVLLKGRISGKQLEPSFTAYELKAKGQTSRSENRWIYTFNPDKITVQELLQKIKASDLVEEADFVKKGG